MNQNKPRRFLLLVALVGAVLMAGTPAGAQNDFVLRAPAAEAEEIAARNGLEIVTEIEVPGDPDAQGLYRVRAADGIGSETVIDTIKTLEPTVIGIEEVVEATLPELDQSVMAILDQSVMAILDGLMGSRALSPPVGQVGSALLGEPSDRTIKKVKIDDGGDYDFHDEKLVFHMQYDDNRRRDDVKLRAEFAPGCQVEFNHGESPPQVSGAPALDFNGRKIEWEITNHTDFPLTVDRVDVRWPAANERLKKVKLLAEVKQLFSPPSVSVDLVDVEEAEDRRIDSGRTEKLTLEFELSDAMPEVDPRQHEYEITVTFAEGINLTSAPCSVAFELEPSYDKNELEWEILNTGHSDVVLEAIEIEWPEENGVISKIEFKGKPILETETVFGKYFNGKDISDRMVWVGYVDQPAIPILRVNDAQKENKGYSTVAIIDTGVDPDHWLLRDALVPGYDFVRDEPGYGSDVDDLLDQSVMAILDGASPMPLEEELPIQLAQSVMAILDADSEDQLSQADLPPSFGHGTMVAGIIHRVAPFASIMPLRAFDSSGHADLLDIVEAIYYAVDHGANVIHMSFSLETFSPELMRAINYAARQGVTSVASAGNQGAQKIVYPAAFGNTIGVASSNLEDELSAFSNLGSDLVTVAAPGEAIVTTFPGGGWAVASGTSFAAPWISGVAAIFADKNGREHQPGRADFFRASEALSHAMPVQGHGSGRAGHGRADLKLAVDRLKSGIDMGSTGLSEFPYLVMADFLEGCSVAYPPDAFGSGCNAQIGSQLEVDGDKVSIEITNDGDETISLTGVEISWPAVHEGLKKIKLDGDEIYNQLLAPSSAIVSSGWKDPDKPERREISPGDTVELTFEFEEEAGS